MGIVYIAVLLASGVLFSQLHYPTKYKLNRSEGWMTYANIVLPGLISLFSVLPVLLWIDNQDYARKVTTWLGLSYGEIKEWGFDFYQLKLMTWFSVSLSASLLAGVFFHILYYRIPYISKRYIRRATSKLSLRDPFEHLIFENTSTQKKRYEDGGDLTYLLFTLKSRRFYVGQCHQIALEHGQLSEIELTPMLSGYRKPKKLKMVVTVNYLEYFKRDSDFKDNPQETYSRYKVVLSRDEIESVSLFEPKQYKEFAKTEEKRISAKHEEKKEKEKLLKLQHRR